MTIQLRNLAVAACSLAAFAARANAVEVLIPSYFYPSGVNNGWPQLNTAAGNVAMTAILNPASGPGTALDTNYRSAVNSLRASGGRVIGYVSTSYTARPIADVKADIAKYKSLYSLDGIFLDEFTNTNDATALAYYGDIYTYIKSLDPNWRVTGNPGTNTQPAYLTSPAAADTLVTFESNTGYAGANPSAWTANYATRRFSNLPYAVSSSTTMVSYVNAAASTKRAGYIYVTDDSGANPWDQLPTYWSAELDAIRAVTPTWSANASGDWNAAGAWTTAAVPNGVGAEALLFGAITTPQTIFTNTNLTLGVLSFNNANRYVVTGAGTLTMDASVEGALIDVRRGNHTINLPLRLHDATVAYIAEGATLTIADPMTIDAGASLTKTGLGTVTFLSTIEDANAPLAISSGLFELGGGAAVRSLSITPGATVAIGENAELTLREQSTNALRASLHSARAGGDWTGDGLTAAGVDERHGLGYASVGGVVTVRLALNGDTNLDGSVTFADLKAVAEHFERPIVATWTDGDVDYDGLVNAADLQLLSANYATPDTFAADWRLAQSLVPEPVTFCSIASLAVASTRRRR